MLDALQSGLLVSELVSNGYTNERRVGPKSQPSRAQSDLVKHASAITASPFVRNWMLAGESRAVQFRGESIRMRKLQFNAQAFASRANAIVPLEKDALSLVKQLLDYMSICQRPLKKNEAQTKSLEGRVKLAETGGVGKLSAEHLSKKAITVRLRAGKKQVSASATLHSEGTSIVALFRFFLGFCSDEATSSHVSCLSVLNQVHRQVTLLVRAACNQSEMLREVLLTSNMATIISMAMRTRRVFDTLSDQFCEDLAWLLNHVSIGTNCEFVSLLG